jgi:hypothetical protein
LTSLIMSSCCTLRLKRRRAFSNDSPSCSRTSAKLITSPPEPNAYTQVYLKCVCAHRRLNANSSLIEVLTPRSSGAHLAYLIGYNESSEKTMKNTKFVVKVNRGGTLKPEYVQRIDRTPIQMTSDRKLALLMGRLTAEDAVKSIQTLRCSPELVSVQVRA